MSPAATREKHRVRGMLSLDLYMALGEKSYAMTNLLQRRYTRSVIASLAEFLKKGWSCG